MHTRHGWKNKTQSMIKELVLGFFCVGIFLWVPTQAQAEELTVDERIKRWEQRLEQMQGDLKEARQLDLTSIEERLEKLERKQPPSQGGENREHGVFPRRRCISRERSIQRSLHRCVWNCWIK